MKNLPKIAIVGASGRMGQMLIQSVLASNKVKLAGVTEREGHDWLGQDLGVCMGGAEIGINVSNNPMEVFKNADAVIDFTSPKATIEHAKLAVKAGIVHVIGTTGMDSSHLDKLKNLSKDIVIIRAGNMSLGLNLLTLLTKKISAALDEDFDIEIVESHHKHKVDAPSGTAIRTAELISSSREEAGRTQALIPGVGQSARGEVVSGVPIHSLRINGVSAKQEVNLGGADELLTISHTAGSVNAYALGILESIRFTASATGITLGLNKVLGI